MENIFTMNGKYLSISRVTLNSNDKVVMVDGVNFNIGLLRKNITYNEHKNLVRFNRKDYKKCIV